VASSKEPTPAAPLPEKKDVNELNLTSNQDSATQSKPAKKGGKLKWIIIIACIVVVLAIVAGAVILILSSTTV
jgi:t-SNARE complex subunit (syntaxin)